MNNSGTKTFTTQKMEWITQKSISKSVDTAQKIFLGYIIQWESKIKS